MIGFGWMGQAHSRGCRRAPSYFLDRNYEPELVVVSDTVEERRDEAVRSFGFETAVAFWRSVVEHDDVDVVFVTAPNMLHVEMVEAAAANGKHVFCEKPVGGTPAQTVAAELAARRAGVISGVGYNYRWAPLVQYAKQLIDSGAIGDDHQLLRAVLLDVRVRSARPAVVAVPRRPGRPRRVDRHPQPLRRPRPLPDRSAAGPITRVVGTGETFIKQRPLPTGAGTHYDRGRPGDPTGEVTNEDYIGMMCVFESGARGTFEACRSMVGPESQNMFEIYGTKGSIRWNFEQMNELQVYIAGDHPHTGFTTVYGGDRFPHHGNFVPGSANGIGFEDLICIEDHEFLTSVAAGRAHVPGFAEAVAYVSVQDAILRSWESGRWEDVAFLEGEMNA